MSLSRRRFLWAAAAACSACLAGKPAKAGWSLGLKHGYIGEKLSPFYQPLEGKVVRCTLCPKGCEVEPGGRGECQVRENRDGKYYSLVYGNPCAVHADPIEKKPFFHVLPGTRSFSLATAGCNFSCLFCQNWEISQKGPEETLNVPLSAAEAAREARRRNCGSLASTYVEPTIFMEYMLDLNQEARKEGMLAVMHSNGFVAEKPLAQLMERLDAACIDLKSSRPEFYREVCNGELEPVKRTLGRLVKGGVHTEIVHLMIPSLNDDPQETRELIRFIRDELSPEVPVHFSRFYPQYKLRNLPPCPISTLEAARRTALKMGLKFVYLGNVYGHKGESTYCPDCGQILIERKGYQVLKSLLGEKGVCPACGRSIPGVWRRPAKALS